MKGGRRWARQAAAVAMEDPCGGAPVTTVLMAFRVGAIFLVLACSGLGVSLTLIGKHVTGFALPSYALLFFKTLGTGILLACALVHLLQPANESLTSPCLPAAFNSTYRAYAYLYCMLAFMGMQFITNGLAALARKARRRAEECRRCEDNVRPDQDVEALAATAAASASALHRRARGGGCRGHRRGCKRESSRDMPRTTHRRLLSARAATPGDAGKARASHAAGAAGDTASAAPAPC